MTRVRLAPAWMCVLWLALIANLTGCKNSPEKLWSREVDSPDHHYQAFAEANVYGAGFGTDYASTEVWIQQNHDAHTKSVIISLASGEPVSLSWNGNANLIIGYRPEDVSGIDFQAVRCCGVDIALTPLPAGSPKPQ